MDYLIERPSSSAAHIGFHIDFLDLIKTFDLPADSGSGQEHCVFSRVHHVRGHTHSMSGGGSFLVEWSGSKAGMKHACSWEPEENLTHCAQLMREWFKLGLTAQKHRVAEAKAMGINAVSVSDTPHCLQ